ncbi:MAG: hypothetical protein DLM55_04660 [Acidimicrobiales bacterium]|nr:MAG: hypothetical protein DLM55_04660 [Acidimicrobiales bacterium]
MGDEVFGSGISDLGSTTDHLLRSGSFDGPVFVISIAAELAGMHPQTLRQYDRLGLVQPGRSAGGGRRYSARDVVLLREIARLSHDEGVNLAGIKRIMELEQEVGQLRVHRAALLAELEHAHDRLNRTALVVWRPQPR